MKFSILTLFLLSVGLIVQAQIDYRDGYVILTNGDSLTGKVSYGNFSRRYFTCRFKPASSRTAVTYLPAEVKAYGYIDDKRFESKLLLLDTATMSQSLVFVEALVKGNMSLFKYKHALYVQSADGSVTYLPPPSSKIVTVGERQFSVLQKSYVGILDTLFKGCSISTEKIDYNETHVSRLIQDYNLCQGSAFVYYKARTKSILINYQIFATLQTTNIYNNKTEKFLVKKANPVLGISVDLSAPRIYDRLFFSVELLYSKQHFNYHESYRLGTAIASDENTIDQTVLKIPLGFRYNLMNDKNTLYMKLGMVYGKVFNLKVDQKQTLTYSDRIVNYTYSRTIDDNQLGIFGAAGFTKAIGQNVKGFVELRYEKMVPEFDLKGRGTVEGAFVYKTFYVTAGLRF